MARGRGSGSGFDFSSGSGSSSSGPHPDLNELYPYPQHTVTALIAISSVFAFIFFLLLFLIRGLTRLLPIPFLLANILFIVRYALCLANSSPSTAIRYEYSVTTLLLRLGLVAVFLAAIHELKLKRRTLTPHFLSLILHAISLLFFHAFFALSIAYVVMEFIIAAQSVDAYPDYNTWRLADFDYGVWLSEEQVTELKTLTNGGTRNASYSFTRFYAEGLREVQVRIGVAISWSGVGMCIVLLLLAGSILLNARSHVGHRVGILPVEVDWDGADDRQPWMLLVPPISLLLTTLLEGIVAVRWILWNTNILSDLGRWAVWARTMEEDLVVQMRTPPGEGWVLGYRTVGKGFVEVYAVLWMVGVLGGVLGVGLSGRRERGSRGAIGKW